MQDARTKGPRTVEYDRFGPWVDEVRAPEDVPPLFRDHPLELGGDSLVLKVPRNIPRRDASPDMDLYDHVLVLAGDALTVLTRQGADGLAAEPPATGYTTTTLRLADVAAVRDSVSVLDARLEVLGRDGGSIVVPYSGSSRARVEQLVATLRDRLPARAPTAAARALVTAAQAEPVGEPDLDHPDRALVADYRAVARELPGMTAWAWHGRAVVAPRVEGAAGAWQRLVHAISPMTVHGGVLAGDDVAVEVIGRHASMVRGKAPELSASRLVVPLGGLDAIELADHPRYSAVVSATLRAGDAVSRLDVPEGSATHRLLTAAAG